MAVPLMMWSWALKVMSKAFRRRRGDEPRAVLEAGKSFPLGAMPSMPQHDVFHPGGDDAVYGEPWRRRDMSGFPTRVQEQAPPKNRGPAILTGLPSRVPDEATRPSGVPGNAIGMFALHSRYGTMPWREIVSVGEHMARFGTQVSRALLTDLKSVEKASCKIGKPKIFRGRVGVLLRKVILYASPILQMRWPIFA